MIRPAAFKVRTDDQRDLRVGAPGSSPTPDPSMAPSPASRKGLLERMIDLEQSTAEPVVEVHRTGKSQAQVIAGELSPERTQRVPIGQASMT